MYIGLHNHTDHSNYRLIDCINKVDDLIKYTREIGHSGVAITDHETLGASVIALHTMADLKSKDPEYWKDYKLILGNEIYLCDRKTIQEDKIYEFPHFILLAKNRRGHEGLTKLSTKSWTENSFVYVNMRVPTYYDNLIEIMKDYKGDIIASTACLGGTLPKMILSEYRANPTYPNYATCLRWIGDMQEIFGKENFFLELQPSDQEEQVIVNREMLKLARISGTNYIITTDSHYLKKADRKVHEAFIKSKEEDREVDDFYNTTYVMSEDEIHSYMDGYLGKDNVSKGISNTMLIYDMVEEYSLDKPMTIPYIPASMEEPSEELYNKYVKYVPTMEWFKNSDYDGDRHLLRDILNKMNDSPEEFENEDAYREIETCFNSIKISSIKQNCHWSAYLLMTKEIVKTCWESGSLVGASRGCFVPGSKVTMYNGQLKNIEDVEIGDKVFTHKGRIRTVQNTMNYLVDENMYTINIPGTESITCTNNHKIFGIPGLKCIYKDNCVMTCKRNNCHRKDELTPRWIEAQDLKPNDMVAIPRYRYNPKEVEIIDLKDFAFNVKYHTYDDEFIYTYHGNNTVNIRKKYQRFIKIDKEFLYFLGVFIGDGWVKTADHFSSIGIAFSTETKKDIKSKKRIEAFLDSLGWYHYDRPGYKDKKVVQLYFSNPFLGCWLREKCGVGAENKHIPDEVLYDSRDDMEELLHGLANSDGSIDAVHAQLNYDTINFHLANQVRNLLSYLGVYSGIYIRPSHDNCKTGYKVSASGKQLSCISFMPLYGSGQKVQRDENYFYPRISSIEIKPYSGYVYDLSIEEDTSYVINNIAVHNSGGGFIFLYMLDICQINPLREDVKTYHWRFLNPERVSPLDVDIDVIGELRDVIIENLQKKYGGYMRVAKVQTLSTSAPRKSIQIACRGLGLTPEEGIFLGGFIKADRGLMRTLHQTYYGDPENDMEPDTEFVNLMNGKYSAVWEIAQRLEGLIVGTGQHSGGVVLVDHDITDSAPLMKTKSGAITTQYDLHNLESCSLIKWDILAIDALTKIKICMELLLKDGLMEWEGSLKATYEKYLGVYSIDRHNDKIWDMIDNHKILSLFQFEKNSGYKAIELGKPRDLGSMAALNSVMRLMAQESGGEAPLDRYARMREDISQWYKEMDEWGLTKDEQKWIEQYALSNYGLLSNQENFMVIVQDERMGGYDLLWADKLRKSIAKKNPKAFNELQEEFYKNIEEKHLSYKLCHYVWDVLITMNKGYGF